MTSYMFVLAFTLVSGKVTYAEQHALFTNQRPIRTMQQCLSSAKEQEERFNKLFTTNPNFMYKSVRITCVERGTR